jgi:hypothetical protein
LLKKSLHDLFQYPVKRLAAGMPLYLAMLLPLGEICFEKLDLSWIASCLLVYCIFIRVPTVRGPARLSQEHDNMDLIRSSGRYGRWAWLLVLGCCLQLPASGCAGETRMNENSACNREIITVDLVQDVASATGYPESRLVSWSKDILCQLFPDDMVQSRSARGLLQLAEKVDKQNILELEAIFLYRTSYTAVTHRVRFVLEDDTWKILSVD